MTRSTVTVKCRLGVDERDSYEQLQEFVETVSVAGIVHFIVHARKVRVEASPVRSRRSRAPQ